MPSLSTSSKSLLILLVLLAASEFIVRGPARFLRAADFNDFISPYIQSRALVRGMDPYSPEVLVRLWPVKGAHRPDFLARDLADGSLIAKRGIPTAYPLTCLFLLTPLAVLPWPLAHFAWLAITVGLTLGLIWSLLSFFTGGGFDRNDWRAYAFVAFSLALAPLHAGLAAGSIVIGTVALCGIAMCRDRRGREIFAGILFGAAVCLKPQIGLPFLAYYMLRRRWRLSGIAVAVVLTTAMLAMARLAIGGTPWIQNYRMDNKVLLATGILSAFTERNPIRFGLINLQVLFYAILHHAVAANVLALAVSAALFGIWLLPMLRSGSHDVLLPMSALAVRQLVSGLSPAVRRIPANFPTVLESQGIFSHGKQVCARHFPADPPIPGAGRARIGATPTPRPDSGNDCTLVVLDLPRDASPDLVSSAAEWASAVADGVRAGVCSGVETRQASPVFASSRSTRSVSVQTDARLEYLAR